MLDLQLRKVEVIVCCLCWYGVSSLTSQLNKVILSQFDYPIFLGEFQFIFNIILGLLTIWLLSLRRFESIRECFPHGTFPKDAMPLNKSLFKTFFPMGTFQFVGKVFSLAATSSCSVATVASIRSLSPLFIVLGYRIYYGVIFPLQTYISLIPLVLGVGMIMISQYGGAISMASIYAQQLKEIENDASKGSVNLATFTYEYLKDTIREEHEFFKGIMFALLATAVFASGSIYAKNVLSTGNNFNVNKKNSLAKLALSSSQINLIPTAESSLDLEAQFRLKIDQEKRSPYGFINYEQKNGDNMIPHMTSSAAAAAGAPDKLTTLMYCSIFGLLYSIPTFITYELPSLLFAHVSHDSLLTDVDGDHTPHYMLIPWTLLIINGVSYFAQSLLAFHILGALSTVSYSIAAMLKRIVIIGVSMLFLGTKINFTGVIGLLHVAIGLYVYEKYGGRQKFKQNRIE